MRLARFALAVAMIVTGGCSSHGGGMAAGGSGGTGGGGVGGTGGGGGTGGSGGGGGTGGTGGSGGGGSSNPNVVTIQTQPFSVPAGGEVFICQDFANPFGGVDTEVAQIDSSMTTGSHHMLLFYQPNATDTNVASCAALQFQAMLFGAQTPQSSMTYPAGVAALVKGTQGFHMQMHYLNATQAPITAQVTISFTKATPGSVQQHAGVFFLNNASGIHVAAGATQDVTASYSFKKNVNLIFATAHTHQFTTNFTASLGSNMIYSTASWDNPPNQQYAPALQLTTGTSVSWTCTVHNTTSGTLTFGESAMTNEMCIFDGQYYPADDNNPTIESMQ